MLTEPVYQSASPLTSVGGLFIDQLAAGLGGFAMAPVMVPGRSNNVFQEAKVDPVSLL